MKVPDRAPNPPLRSLPIQVDTLMFLEYTLGNPT